MGAAFTLLISAAIGPFTQQSIELYACQRPLHNISATIPTAKYLNASLIVGRETLDDRYPNLNIMAAALDGLVGSSDASKTLPFDCPTGDCDFDPYSSLAFCSSCADITSRVRQEWGPNYYEPEVYSWNYTVYDRLGPHCQLTFEDIGGHPRLTPNGQTGESTTNLVMCPGGWSSSALSFTVMSTTREDCSDDHQDGNRGGSGCGRYPHQLPSLANTTDLVAMNCTLQLCVGDYTGRVRKGVLSETMTSSIPSSVYADEPSMFKILKLPCLVDSKPYDLSNIIKVPSISGRNFTIVSHDGKNLMAPLECVFATNKSAPLAIGLFLQVGLFKTQMGNPHPGVSCSLNSIEESSYCDPWYAEPIFRGGRPTAATITADMNRIAVAISNQMRAVGSNSYMNASGVAMGTVIQTTVCVRVDWPWLLFPAALMLLTVVLLVAVIIKARRSQNSDGQPVWKSSAVAAFFHGLDAVSDTQGRADREPARHAVPSHEPEGLPVSASMPRRESHENLMTLESMHAKAKKTLVKLETTVPGGRGFVVVNEKVHDHHMDSKEDGQRCSTDSHRDGEAMPLHRLPSNDSLREQPPEFSQVNLGIGLAPSARTSLDRST